MTARVNPGGRRDIGIPAWLIAVIAGRVAGTRAPNLFLVLGKHRKLFRGWLHFAGRLMPGGLLKRRETELVILRIAHRRGCRYEFEHHSRLGRRAGLTATDIDRVTAEPGADGGSPREQTLLATADALLDKHDLDDADWRRLRDSCSEREAIELCLLVGHYDMLATTITALRIPLDETR